MKTLVLTLNALAVTATVALAQGDQGGDGPARGWGHHGWGSYHHGGHHVFFAIFVLLLIFLALRWSFWGFRYRRCGPWYHHGYGQDRGALGILEDRFARGEISKEEFEEKRKALRQSLF
jgi:putative membrane protein